MKYLFLMLISVSAFAFGDKPKCPPEKQCPAPIVCPKADEYMKLDMKLCTPDGECKELYIKN